jgi:hypothetical protein
MDNLEKQIGNIVSTNWKRLIISYILTLTFCQKKTLINFTKLSIIYNWFKIAK